MISERYPTMFSLISERYPISILDWDSAYINDKIEYIRMRHLFLPTCWDCWDMVDVLSIGLLHSCLPQPWCLWDLCSLLYLYCKRKGQTTAKQVYLNKKYVRYLLYQIVLLIFISLKIKEKQYFSFRFFFGCLTTVRAACCARRAESHKRIQRSQFQSSSSPQLQCKVYFQTALEPEMQMQVKKMT